MNRLFAAGICLIVLGVICLVIMVLWTQDETEWYQLDDPDCVLKVVSKWTAFDTTPDVTRTKFCEVSP